MDYQNHRLPFYFLSAIFRNVHSELSGDIKDYFKPYRVIISEGYDKSHWVLNNNLNREEYNALWKDAQLYIQHILKNGPEPVKLDVSIDPVKNESSWEDIAVKKAFIFEFEANLPVELLKSFMDIKSSLDMEFSGIKKMAILPWYAVGNNFNTVFILDDNKLYKYLIPFNSEGLDKDKYREITIAINNEKGMRSYGVVKELFSGQTSLRQDILCAVRGSKYDPVSEASCITSDPVSDINKLTNIILGSEKDIYSLSTDFDNTIVFMNQNNIYRIYNDGVLEYKYLPTLIVSEKGSINDAFKRALEFMNAKDGLVSGTELYLTGIREEGLCYMFTFDYLVNNIPVYFNYETGSKEDKKPLNNGIVIKANAKRVVDCRWILKNFKYYKEHKNYSVSFADMFDTFEEYDSLAAKKVYIDDIRISYEVKPDTAFQELKPVWVIETEEKDYIIPLPEEKGE